MYKPTLHDTTGSYKGKLYPDGSASLGYVGHKKKAVAEKEYDRHYEQQFDSYEVVHKSYRGITREEVKFFSPLSEEKRHLGSSSLQNSHKNPSEGCKPSSEGDTPSKKKRYGSNGISSHGKKMIKSGCKILQTRYDKSQLALGTVTLPSLGFKEIVELAENWAEVSRKFLQEIQRELVRKGGDKRIVACTEIQEKRYRRTGMPCPHLHFLIRAWDGKSYTNEGKRKWYISANKLRDIWQRIICNQLGIEPETLSVKASCDVSTIKKSAKGYMGKYMSKGGKIIKEINDKGLSSCLPKQWWSCYGGIGKQIRDSIIELTGEIAQVLIEGLHVLRENGYIAYFKKVYATYMGEERHFGYAMSFTEEGLEELHLLIAHLILSES